MERFATASWYDAAKIRNKPQSKAILFDNMFLPTNCKKVHQSS